MAKIIFESCKVGTRGQLTNFILAEKESANGWSRKFVPFVSGVVKGDLIKADGSKATAAADIAGIALINAPSSIGNLTSLSGVSPSLIGNTDGVATGIGVIETGSELQQVMLYRDAEVKDLHWSGITGDVIAALAKLRITVVPTNY